MNPAPITAIFLYGIVLCFKLFDKDSCLVVVVAEASLDDKKTVSTPSFYHPS
jgi:hypothetical protein